MKFRLVKCCQRPELREAMQHMTDVGASLPHIGEYPWVLEPDFFLAEVLHAGVVYSLIVRRHKFGHLTGYVGAPEEVFKQWSKDFLDNLDVHGGLTYGGSGPDDEAYPGYHYVGFDCAHSDDITPWTLRDLTTWDRVFEEGTYKTVSYVLSGVLDVLTQLLASLVDFNARPTQSDFADLRQQAFEALRAAGVTA